MPQSSSTAAVQLSTKSQQKIPLTKFLNKTIQSVSPSTLSSASSLILSKTIKNKRKTLLSISYKKQFTAAAAANDRINNVVVMDKKDKCCEILVCETIDKEVVNVRRDDCDKMIVDESNILEMCGNYIDDKMVEEENLLNDEILKLKSAAINLNSNDCVESSLLVYYESNL